MAAVRAPIDLLSECRTCPIAGVVTGKLDVRGIGLPDSGDAETGEDE